MTFAQMVERSLEFLGDTDTDVRKATEKYGRVMFAALLLHGDSDPTVFESDHSWALANHIRRCMSIDKS